MTKVYRDSGKGAAYLREHGINPIHVSADDWNAEGYLEIQFDGEGNLRTWPGTVEPVMVFRFWPKGFDYREFHRIVTG